MGVGARVDTDVRELSPPLPSEPADDTTAWSSTCLNCGGTINGHFCSECGQRAVPPYPTLRELGGEAFEELSGWDGKILTTLRVLVRSPGKLTTEFLKGRRARYISPVRLYLWCSVLYFLLAASNHREAKPGEINLGAFKAGVTNGPTNSGQNQAMTDAQKQDLLAQSALAPPIFRPVLRKLANDPAGFQNDVFEGIPKAMFVLLPAFAAIVALFYRRRRFPEHIYFAVHVHALLFLGLILTALANMTHVLWIELVVSVPVLLWLPIYWHLAIKNVYGGSHGVTMLKELAISVLYLAATLPVLVAVAIWVAARGGA